MPTMKAVSMVTSSALPWSCLFVLIFIVYLWGLNGEFYGFRMTTLADRSEEHTSELQSRSDLVCRLLLEKKKIVVCLIYIRELIQPRAMLGPLSRTTVRLIACAIIGLGNTRRPPQAPCCIVSCDHHVESF